MPLPLLAILLAACATAALAVVVFIVLKWDEIIDWFTSRNAIKTKDADNIAFTLKERLASGKYKVVQGIFNKRTDVLVEGRNIEAETLDRKAAAAHKGEDVVVYT
jgi:hypothetical protein